MNIIRIIILEKDYGQYRQIIPFEEIDNAI